MGLDGRDVTSAGLTPVIDVVNDDALFASGHLEGGFVLLGLGGGLEGELEEGGALALDGEDAVGGAGVAAEGEGEPGALEVVEAGDICGEAIGEEGGGEGSGLGRGMIG